MSLIFEGLRVVDLTTGSAGPLCSMVMADNGAEVVKVEPPGGDPARHAAGFQMWNRGKRSVVLDLDDDEGVARLHALILASDVIVIDRADHTLPLELRKDDLRAAAPHLVHCTICDDPLDGQTSASESVVAARSGRFQGLDLLSGGAIADASSRPVYVASPIGSYAAAMLALQGITGALLGRVRTGHGAALSTSILDGLAAATMRLSYKREGDRVVPAKAAVQSDLMLKGIMLTFMTAECADGRFIQMCARQDDHFRNWLAAAGLDEMAAEPRFARAPMQFESAADLEEMTVALRAAMRTRTQAEWMELFTTKYNVGADPMLTAEEFLAHPQMALNDRTVRLDSPDVGVTVQVGPLACFSSTPSRICESAPALGAHQSLLADVASRVPARPRPNGAGRGATTLPFAGTTVIELASFLAGPFGATLLAENGARVIKVEPLSGDSFRRVGLEAVHLNHGKESLAIDLKRPEGREILHALVGRADVLLHNFRVGVVERLGADYETLRVINPDLVYVFAASYGSKGPQARRPAFHSTPHALCGAGILQAGRGNPPVDDSYPDPCAAIAVAAAMAMGLLARERFGGGQYIETMMLASAGYVHGDLLTDYQGRPDRPVVDGDQRGTSAFHRLYPCASGWLFIDANPGDLGAISAIVGEPSLESAFAARVAREGALGADEWLTASITDRLRACPAGEWAKHFVHEGIAAVVADAETFEEHLLRMGMVMPAGHATVGDYFRLRSRIRFDDVAPSMAPPCALGEHTASILAEIGYSPAQCEQLANERVITL